VYTGKKEQRDGGGGSSERGSLREPEGGDSGAERGRRDRQIRRWICILIRNLSESSTSKIGNLFTSPLPPVVWGPPLVGLATGGRRGRGVREVKDTSRAGPRESYPPVLFLPHYAGLASSTCRTYQGAKLFLPRGLAPLLTAGRIGARPGRKKKCQLSQSRG
jgi:hypothetical protein